MTNYNQAALDNYTSVILPAVTAENAMRVEQKLEPLTVPPPPVALDLQGYFETRAKGLLADSTREVRADKIARLRAQIESPNLSVKQLEAVRNFLKTNSVP